MPEAFLQAQNLSVTFTSDSGDLETLRDVSFTLYPQEFVCLIGPSGSGKTTLLRALAGLLAPSQGTIAFPSCQEHPRVGLVFQQANLMPWRSVLANITLPLEVQGVPAAQAERQAGELIELVGLQGFEKAWPRELSGGMAQRVAIARALIQDPDLLLLDEPFGSLDALTREHMGEELLRLWQARRTTVLMVTHSIGEALLLSDRVLVFTPRPANICLDLTVDLERPREGSLRYTQRFSQLSQQLRTAIGDNGN